LVWKKSPKAIRVALRKLPSGSDAYDHAYKDAMVRIKGQVADQEELAKQVLSWITCAKRPLTTLELQYALAVEVGESELDEDNLAQIEDLITVCAGLVTVDEESGIIRLVHYTTQEYFERTQSHWFPIAETDITTICVTYLSFNVFERGFCETDDKFEERLLSNQFFEYAARNWGHHARKVSTISQALKQAIVDFLESEAKVNASSQGLLAIKSYSSHSNYSQEVPKSITGLHLTAYFGVESIVLDTSKVDADSKDTDGRTPLSWAAESGQEAIVKLLLDISEVDADSKGAYGRTPLSWAAESGHEAIVKLLLDTGKVDADSIGAYGRTPLSWAAESGHEAIVKLLLDISKVDADSKDTYGRTPLSWAAESGREAIVKLLLDIGKADADSKDAYARTPLSWAAEREREAIVMLLLDISKVDADSKDAYGRTPLWRAAESGHEAIVKLLLDTGKVDADSKDAYGRTPLSWAAERGHEAIVKLLLDTGKVNADSKSTFGQTPLSWAAESGHESIVKFLLEKGADINIKNRSG
jgi:ankyrin repeat protein